MLNGNLDFGFGSGRYAINLADYVYELVAHGQGTYNVVSTTDWTVTLVNSTVVYGGDSIAQCTGSVGLNYEPISPTVNNGMFFINILDLDGAGLTQLLISSQLG